MSHIERTHSRGGRKYILEGIEDVPFTKHTLWGFIEAVKGHNVLCGFQPNNGPAYKRLCRAWTLAEDDLAVGLFGICVCMRGIVWRQYDWWLDEPSGVQNRGPWTSKSLVILREVACSLYTNPWEFGSLKWSISVSIITLYLIKYL